MDENLFQPSSEVFGGNTTFQEFFFKSCLPKLMGLITHLNKRLVFSLTAVAIIVLLFAVVTQVERGDTPSSVSSVTSSSSSSSRSSTSFPVILGFLISGFEENQGTLLASPSAPLNYSLVVTRFNNGANQVRLSAMSTVPGVSVAVSPRNFSFFGDREAVTLGISVDSSVNSDILQIRIVAATEAGVANKTFYFQLVKGLIVVLPWLKPANLRVGVGQTVTWLNLIPPADEGIEVTATIRILNESMVSPILHYNNLWSHVFNQPGTYAYELVTTSYASFAGEVIVS